jgi:hypothetical protein
MIVPSTTPDWPTALHNAKLSVSVPTGWLHWTDDLEANGRTTVVQPSNFPVLSAARLLKNLVKP